MQDQQSTSYSKYKTNTVKFVQRTKQQKNTQKSLRLSSEEDNEMKNWNLVRRPKLKWPNLQNKTENQLKFIKNLKFLFFIFYKKYK